MLEFLAAGDSVEEVLEEYPALTREDVLACIARVSAVSAGDAGCDPSRCAADGGVVERRHESDHFDS